MIKVLIAAITGAMLITAAYAAGIAPPVNGGYVQPDANWLYGIAGGVNNSYQYGITAAGTTQATSTQLPSQQKLIEIDTTASGTGVALPPAYQGTEVLLYNNGASTLTIYPNVANNPVTSAQDTINNTTSVTVTTHTAELFFCAKTGVWAVK